MCDWNLKKIGQAIDWTEEDIQFCSFYVRHQDGEVGVDDLGGKVGEDLLHQTAGGAQDKTVHPSETIRSQLFSPNKFFQQNSPCFIRADDGCISKLAITARRVALLFWNINNHFDNTCNNLAGGPRKLVS